ncbi:MAG: pyridoxal phosphate-dependent aminotransferase [Erysipelotrichaceae bacterium]|jgi:putative C-S lyase|nr:pyridoxal phosphate-dependent aminotransferase [Erysipelotrichaceae bacterium]
MKYDFTEVFDRYDCGSQKWAAMGEKQKKGIVPLSVADMEFATPPQIKKALTKWIEDNPMGYTGPTDSYYQAVISWMKRKHHWDVKKEWIVTTPGVVIAVCTAVQLLTKPGDGILMLTPIYSPFFRVLRYTQTKLVDCPLIHEDHTYHIDFADLDQKLAQANTKVMILCSPHNPVGRIWSKEELKQIAELCKKHGVFILADEIHNDLALPGYTHTVLTSLDPSYNDFVITFTSGSKTFNLAGLQLSNIIIANQELREKFIDTMESLHVAIQNCLSYTALMTGYNECEDWVNEVLLVIEGNYRVLKDFLSRHFPKADLAKLEGTYLAWVDMNPYFKDLEHFHQFLREDAKFFIIEGEPFGTGGYGFLRINLACARSTIEKALDRLAKAYQNYVF